MKLISLVPVLILSVVFAASPLYAKNAPPVKTPVITPLSVDEVETLVFMREEEKMARDVYLSFYEQLQLVIFTNIASAEQQHMDALKVLLDQYAIDDPVVDNTVGAFTDPGLLALYESLLVNGFVGEIEALYVGALIEEIDIQDLIDAIAESDHTDVIQAYENLLQGSRNHLRAFVRNIESRGLIYEAQYMDQDQVDEILDNPMERKNKGKRKGKKGGR
ncbi:MAG: DUF2202 domain-containing protein [Proteobacteria bacterium]|nr:DUF2202 domain-containing protein [Pseudomonadota bacterium]